MLLSLPKEELTCEKQYKEIICLLKRGKILNIFALRQHLSTELALPVAVAFPTR